MNQLSKISLITSALTIALSCACANAIEITTDKNAEELANQLIIPDSGVTITGFSLLGGFLSEGGNDGPNTEVSVGLSAVAIGDFTSPQAGIFTNSTNVYGLPQSGGVVFSSGNVADYGDGPNLSSSNTGFFGNGASEEQNNLLSPITGQSQHFDPIELNIEFDVDAGVDVISFIAAFGSEEFPEFVGSGFIDGFGMFLNGTNVAGALQTGASPGASPLPININHPDFADIRGTELDGVIAPNGIPLMRFDVPVVPGSTGNTFKLLLADAGDAGYDSTIFLSSFGDFDSDGGNSEFTPILPDPSNPPNADGSFVFELPNVAAGATIWFDPDIATGYTYAVSGGGLFASVTAPTLLTVNDPDGYIVTYVDGGGFTVTEALFASGTVVFSSPVSDFTITGINTDLMLDPTDFSAFVTGVSFNVGGSFSVTQTPITTFIPGSSTPVSAPGTMAMFGIGLLGLISLRRKQK